MKYLIILYASYNDGTTADKKAMYEADSADSAVALWHGYLSTYMKDTTVAMVTCIAISAKGEFLRNESYTRTTTTDEETTE